MHDISPDTIRAFQRAFIGDNGQMHEDGKLMAAYLHALCNDGVSNPKIGADGHIDQTAQAMAIGRLQVWNRIYTLLNVNANEVSK